VCEQGAVPWLGNYKSWLPAASREQILRFAQDFRQQALA